MFVRFVRFLDKCPIVRNCSALKLTAKLLARQPIHLGEGPRRVLAHENRNEEKLRLVSGRQNNNKKDKTDNMKTSLASSGGVNETRARSIQHPTSRIQDEKVISVSICLRIFHFPYRLHPISFCPPTAASVGKREKGKAGGLSRKSHFPKLNYITVYQI